MAEEINYDDFTITDPWGREIRFFVRDGKYYRQIVGGKAVGVFDADPKEISEFVYNRRYGEACADPANMTESFWRK